MAGWKLRKDKASTDVPETSEETSEAIPTEISAETPADPLMPRWDTPAAETEEAFFPTTLEPAFETDRLDTEFDDAELKHTGPVIALGGESDVISMSPLPDFEVGEEVNFDDDEDETSDEDEAHAALIFHDPVPPALEVIYAPPAQAAPSEPIAMEPASVEPAFIEPVSVEDPSEAVPEVAPFVMDAPAAPPATDLPHRLVMRVGRLSAAFEVTKEVTVIGRPDSSLHYYPDIEIEMDDAVSRRHAEVLKATDGEYYLLDSGSTNGTRLNGEALPANEERLLAHGDRIHIGERTEIIFE